MSHPYRRRKKQAAQETAPGITLPAPVAPMPAENVSLVPVITNHSGHTARSPLPHDLHREKPVQTVNAGKEGKEYIRYRLTPEELQALKNAYPERRCQDAVGARHRKRD